MGGASGDNEEYNVHEVRVRAVNSLQPAGYDAAILVLAPDVSPPQELQNFIKDALQFDSGLEKECGVLRCDLVAGGRLIVSPTGPITPYHDLRSVTEAVAAGVKRAVRAGSRRPVLILQPHAQWPRAELAALLAAFEALQVPLQVRETSPESVPKLEALGVYGDGLVAPLPALLRDAAYLDIARGVARDIGGGDPERMAPLEVARYIQASLEGSGVSVRVLDDPQAIKAQYPLFAAVSRAADSVERHRGCVVFLEYTPATYERTVMLVGKGVTYDTGGADVKAGGVMAGMSRDKCGAAAIAGFLKACALLRADVRVVGALALVRNSIGEESYVADELIVSRRGLRVRIGNTDAEGRMVMADLLAEMHERALKEKNPHVYTIATLTGHAHRAVGDGYSIVLDNHVARETHHAEKLRASGESLADMIEISTLRREDLKTHRGRSDGDHLHQADNMPSTQMPRGHQSPAAFLLLAAGLETGSVAYSHLDIAASGGSLPHPPTGAPLIALAAHYGLVRSC